MSCTVLMRLLMKATNLFSKHGQRVSNSNKIIRGPTKEDMRVVNQDSNQFWDVFLSFFFFDSALFFYLGQGLLDYPCVIHIKTTFFP